MSVCVYINSKLAFILKNYQKLNTLLFHKYFYLANLLLSLLGYAIVHFSLNLIFSFKPFFVFCFLNKFY